MGVRLQKLKTEKKFKLIKKILCLFAIFLIVISIIVWVMKFFDNEYSDLIIITQSIFIIVILLYLSVTSNDMQLYTSIIKSFTKLFFNVWLVMFILTSVNNQTMQNLWMIYISMGVGYFEVMLELDESIKEEILDSHNTASIKFLKNEELSKLTRPINIIVICIIHLLISSVMNPAVIDNLNNSILVK